MTIYTAFHTRHAMAMTVAMTVGGLFCAEASAIAFDSNISINASVDLDAASAPATSGASQSAGFNGIFGGVASSSSVDSTLTVETGPVPLNGNLTQLHDGVGMQFRSSANSIAGTYEQQELFGNYLFNFVNHSATDTYKISLGISYDNQQNAFGNTDIYGAFSRGELHFFDLNKPGKNLFFSDNTSDNLYGNIKNNTDLPTFGGLVSSTGVSTLDLLLSPGASLILKGFNDLRGAADDMPAGYTGLLNSFVAINDVVDVTTSHPVPSPGSLWLVLAGFMSWSLFGHRRALAPIREA